MEPQLARRLKFELAEKITPTQRAMAKAENPAKQGFVALRCL